MPADFAPPPLSETVRTALRDFAQVAIGFLTGRAPGGRIPVVLRLQTQFSDTDERHWEEAYRELDVSAISIDAAAFNELSLDRPGARKRARADGRRGNCPARTDSKGRPLTDEHFDRILVHLGQLPVDGVRLYLTRRRALDGPVAIADLQAAFADAQRRLMNVTVDVLASAPLKYFSMEATQIGFPDGVTIERMSAADKANLWRDDYLDDEFTKSTFAKTWYRLAWRYQRPRQQMHDFRLASERFDRVLSALRLVQPGHTEAPKLVIEEVPRTPPGGMSSLGKFRDRSSLTFFEGRKYELHSQSIPALIQVDSQLSGLRSDGSGRAFALALRRYNQSFLRGATEDSLIDLAIALESTLLAGTRDELKHRLSLRGAILLRRSLDPREVYGFLSTFYDARSGIVHDGLRLQDMKPTRLGGISPLSFLPRAQAIVRLVLLHILERLRAGEDLQVLVRHLDDAVVDSLSSVT